MQNYSGSVAVGTRLYVGDTVTSLDGHYVMEIVPTGIVLNLNGQIIQWLLSGFVTLTSARLTAEALVIYASGGPYAISFNGFMAVQLCVEDTGQVDVFDVSGNAYCPFNSDQALQQSGFPGPNDSGEKVA